LEAIDRHLAQNVFSATQGRVLRDIIERFYFYFNNAAPVLNHGDITEDNLLWYEGNVVSLLDFEHAAVAPPQMDLHSIINLAFINDDAGTNLLIDDNPEAKHYVADLTELFAPLFSQEGAGDLLVGFTVLFRQFFLNGWLEEHNAKFNENYDTKRNGVQDDKLISTHDEKPINAALSQSTDYLKIKSFCDAKGGYLAGLLINQVQI
jgi:thiamine kinase-like enzyme